MSIKQLSKRLNNIDISLRLTDDFQELMSRPRSKTTEKEELEFQAVLNKMFNGNGGSYE